MSFSSLVSKIATAFILGSLAGCHTTPSGFVRVGADAPLRRQLNEQADLCVNAPTGEVVGWLRLPQSLPLPLEGRWSKNGQDFRGGIVNPFGDPFAEISVVAGQSSFKISPWARLASLDESKLKPVADGFSLITPHTVREIFCGAFAVAGKDVAFFAVRSSADVPASLGEGSRFHSFSVLETRKGRADVDSDITVRKEQNKIFIKVTSAVSAGFVVHRSLGTLVWSGTWEHERMRIQQIEVEANGRHSSFVVTEFR